MAQTDQLRRSLLAATSGRRDGTPGFVQFADEFEQNVVNKRLRIGESVVDTAQPSLVKVARAVMSSGNDDSKRQAAVREIVRYEVGPLRTNSAIIETCERETKLYNEQLTDLEAKRQATLRDIERLKTEVADAKTYPRDEVEKLAKACNKLPTKAQHDQTVQNTRAEIARLKQQREKLRLVLDARKIKLGQLAQVLEEFREECRQPWT